MSNSLQIASLFVLGACAHFGPPAQSLLSNENLTMREHKELIKRSPSSELRPITLSARLAQTYAKYAPADGVDWFAESVPNAFQMSSGNRPVDAEFNTSILWAFDHKTQVKLFGMRPVDTTTGCHSGCTPVIFHLEISPEGKVLAIIEESDKPLRKVGHKALSEQEKSFLLKISNDFPKILEKVDETPLLTDDFIKVIPQTWTVFSESLVKGGAYTSYRVYEAALKSFQYLNIPEAQVNAEYSEAGDFEGTTYQLKTLDQLRAVLEQARLNLDLARKTNWLSSKSFKVLPQLSASLLRNSQAEADVARVKNIFTRGEYFSFRINDYCTFVKGLLNQEATLPLALQFSRDTTSFANCGNTFNNWIAFLSAQDPKATVDLQALPTFVLSDSRYLELAFRAATRTRPVEEWSQLAAVMMARYPKLNLPEFAKIDRQSASFQALLKSALSSYRSELRRMYLKPALRLPPLPGKLDGVQTSLDVIKGPKLLVFFASWCPHCQHKIKSWIDLRLPQKFWDSIQLVQILNLDSTPLEEFCKVTGHPCTRIFVPDQSKQEYTQFIDALSIQGVPTMTLLDSQMKLQLDRVDIGSSEFSDVNRDLAWLLESE